jgi:hypothetical protein
MAKPAMREDYDERTEDGSERCMGERLRRQTAETLSEGRELAERQIEGLEQSFGEFWKQLGNAGLEPFSHAVARANLEIVGLASRRARAYAEWPGQVMQCHSPLQLMGEQASFVRELVEDYNTTAARMVRNFMDAQTEAMSQARR